MSATIALTLPVCPSTNSLWITPPHFKRRVRSPEYATWLRSAGWVARSQLVGVPTITGTFTARIEVPAKSRRDRDNWSKALMDLCQSVGAVRNDAGLRDYEVVGADRSDVLVVLTDCGGPEQREPKQYRVGPARPKRATTAQIARFERTRRLLP